MNRTLKLFAALSLLAAPVAAQNTPIVTVLAFDNGAFGPGAKDYDGVGKGIMDMVITDLATSGKVRVVERARIQSILDEQNLTKSGAVDATTAVRVGRIFGACYSVFGAFTRNDKTGQNVLTIRATSNETSQVLPGTKVESKGDDILGLINEATTKFIKELDLTACPGNAGARRSGDASPAQQGGAQTQAQAQPPATKAAPQNAAASGANRPAAAAPTVTYAKALSAAEVKKLESPKARIDARAMLLYSRALDAKDQKQNARAKQLAEQVLAKYSEFSPARELIASLN